MEIKKKLTNSEMYLFFGTMSTFLNLFLFKWISYEGFSGRNGFELYIFGQILTLTSLAAAVMIMLPLFDVKLSEYIPSTKGKEKKIIFWLAVSSVVLAFLQGSAYFAKAIFNSEWDIEFGIIFNFLAIAATIKGIYEYNTENKFGIKLPKIQFVGDLMHKAGDKIDDLGKKKPEEKKDEAETVSETKEEELESDSK